MADFFEKTWFIWWTIAVFGVLRWLHASSTEEAWDEVSPDCDTLESNRIPDPLTSSPS